MKDIYVYSETMSPIERLEFLAYARKYAKKFVGYTYNGIKISRIVLPACKGEGVIEGINY